MKLEIDQVRWQDNPTEECTGWTWTCPQCGARCIDCDKRAGRGQEGERGTMTAAQWRELLDKARAMEEREQAEKVHHQDCADLAEARRDKWADRVDWLLAELNEAMEQEGIET